MVNMTKMQNLADYLNNHFYDAFSSYEIDYISKATDVLTPDDDATPVDLCWYWAKSDKTPDFSFITQIMLLCVVCFQSEDGSIIFDESCFSKGVCIS